MSLQLTRIVSTRVPVEVALEWQSAAAVAGLALSDWLRQAVDPGAVEIVDYRRPTPRRRISKADPELLCAIARIGGNVNQIARNLNVGVLRSERPDLLRCLRVLVEIQDMLAAVARLPDFNERAERDGCTFDS